MSNIAEKITELVTIPNVLSSYGYPLGRHKRIPCPLHGGKNSNFCYTDKVFHCWTCGEKGNVITLAMKIKGITFSQALTRMNLDFNLNLSTAKPTYRERVQAVENKKIEKAIRKMADKKRQYYSGIAVFHREIFRKISNGDNDEFLLKMEKSLDEWLDANREGVMQPWN